MTHKEYRVTHEAPGVATPMMCSSLEEAQRFLEIAEAWGSSFKIQTRTVTEWENV